MNTKVVPTIALVLSTVLVVNAAELKVDINNNNRAISEGLDPAYTSWNDVTAWFPGGNTISKSFSGVTVTFTRTGSAGTALKPGYNKPYIQSTTLNVKLTADGITVDNGEAGAQIQMRISGLSAGTHTVAVYHNSWDNLASLAPLNVSVDGTQVLTNVPTSINVTDNLTAGLSYVTVTATAGQDVVILFAARTSGGEASKNVYINAFEIDTLNPKLVARNPIPANADEHVDADSKSLTLQWTPAYSGTVLSHDVYFGTNSTAVKNATHASAEFKGNQAGTSYPVTGLNSLLTYYWRVDELSASGTTKGNLWYFRPRHLAFPGAEGYGRFARGGRGGVVREVTNLNDSGPGSFRDAIEGNYGPRTVVFTVSGQIILNANVIMDSTMPPITVAGQTAPGKGICFRRQQFAMNGARDAIARDVRVRVGKESGETQNGSGMSGVDNSIMDHCSISWGIDEELSSRNAKNMTFQRCHISEALNVAGHDHYPPGKAHGFAASIGGDTASFHHNLLAHCEGRNWSLAGGLDASGYYSGRLDIFNNVVYNWGGRATDGGAHEVNFVNNYYKPGAATSQHIVLKPQYGGFPGTQQYYMVGNVEPGYFTVANQSAGLEISTETGGTVPADSTPPYNALVGSPFFPSYATIDEVTNGYKKVLSDVGCTQPAVDDHDVRVIRETIDGTYTYSGSVSGKHGLPDTTDDVGGWENYGTAVRPADWDTDHDGLPNWWEVIKGLDTNSSPGDYSDANADLVGDEYTELERYINWMAEPHADCNAGATVDIDLNSLSRGFTNSSPSYTFSNQVSGTVSLVSNRFARFAPTTSANALGGFDYKVTDNKGYTMTRTLGIRIIGSGAAPTNPPATPTGLNATAGDAQVSLTWNAAFDATSYIVKRSTTNGGPYLGIITNATTSYVNSGLVNGTPYYYVVVARNLIGDSGESSQASATPELAAPNADATAVTISSIQTSQMTVSWTPGNGANRLVVARAGSAPTGTPVDGLSYAANAAYGGGATLGDAYVVYNGSGNSFTATGLSPATVYHFKIFEYNGSDAQTLYYTAGTPGSSSRTTLASAPGVSASGVSFTGVTNNSLMIHWTAGDGSNHLVVVKQGSAVSSAPVDGTTYNANPTFTSGSQIGAGNYVVSAGGGTSVTVSGLAAGTTYHVAVYEFNGSGGTENYLTNLPATGSQTTSVGGPAGAITVGDVSEAVTGSSSSFSLPVTVSAGTKVLVVLLNGKSGSTYTPPASLTWNGQTLTNAVSAGAATILYSSIYYLFNPPVGTGDATGTIGGASLGWAGQSYTLSGVVTSVAPLTGGPGSGNNNTLSFSIANCPEGGLAAATAGWGAAGDVTMTATSGTMTSTFSGVYSGSYPNNMGYVTDISAGSETFTATVTGAGHSSKRAFAVAVFTPVTGPTGPTGPGSLTHSINGSTLTLTWPAGQGWRLVSNTNLVSTNGWVPVPGGIDGSNSITINSTNPMVFYRLVSP